MALASEVLTLNGGMMLAFRRFRPDLVRGGEKKLQNISPYI